ncbi:site-2 protease family protein [bacterium]|nr:site-2 protease family protein [bacterium]
MDIQTVAFLAPGFIAGLTLHEFSHALVAHRLGDNTAAQLGRLTLNPLKHLDFFGSLMLVFAGFGWAKPVPVNSMNLKNPRSDMLWISLAGPFSNLLLAITVGSIVQFFYAKELVQFGGEQPIFFILLLQTVWINVILAVFNMIPLPPLDGSSIIEAFIPRKWYVQYHLLSRIGPGLLLGIILISSLTGFSVFGRVLLPIARPVFNFCLGGWQLL